MSGAEDNCRRFTQMYLHSSANFIEALGRPHRAARPS
jgi:hypothetical protein